MATVAIIQPYVPHYRVPLFDGLRAALEADGHVLRLITGSPEASQAERNDQAPPQPGQVVVRDRHVRVGPVGASWKRVTPHLDGADLVIAQLGAGIIDTHRLVSDPRLHVATWGHGFAATGHAGAVDTTLERWQLRRSCHFFAYTERGAASARRAGLHDDRITVLDNTIDTSELLEARAALASEEAGQFRDELGLGHGPVAAYIGGLDEPKRIDMLLEAADAIADRVDGFRLVIAGDGPMRDTVRRAAEQPHVVEVGYADTHMKARLAAVGSVLLHPGGVGLIAVDSFALELPIVTAEGFGHGPEFDYLRHGSNAVVTADDVDAFVESSVTTLLDAERLGQLREGCRKSLDRFSLDAMIERFRRGIDIALDAPRQRARCGR